MLTRMMAPKGRVLTLAATLALLGAWTATADDERYRSDDERYRCISVDIEDLDARLIDNGDAWTVRVDYEVEIEGTHHVEGLALVLSTQEHGRLLADRNGQPIEIIIPLDRPSEVDDDEVEFEQTISFTLPDEAFVDPGALRLTGVVIGGPEGPVLDRDDTHISYHRPWNGHVSVGVGVGVGVGIGVGVHVGPSIDVGVNVGHRIPRRVHHRTVYIRRSHHQPVSHHVTSVHRTVIRRCR